MLSLRRLRLELRKLGATPDEVCIAAALYDGLLDEAEDVVEEENPDSSEDED